MARQAKQAAQALEEAVSVYDEVWNAIVGIDPKFPAPTSNETDQQFFQRLLRAVSDILPENHQLSAETDAWYATAFEQYTGGVELDPPPGFGDGGEEGAADANGVDDDPPVVAAKRGEGLARWRAEQAAKKAAAAAAGAVTPSPAKRTVTPVPAAPAAPAAAPRRGLPAAAPIPPAAAPTRRGLLPAVAPTPTRRGAAAPVQARRPPAPVIKEERVPSQAAVMREIIIENIDITGDELFAMLLEQGYNPNPASVAGVVTSVKSTIAAIKRFGHWRD